MTSRSRLSCIAFVLAAALVPSAAMAQQQPATGAATTPAVAAEPAANADWPCIQHKQSVLTAAQMWDGPAIAAEGERSNDSKISKLVPALVSRRIPVADLEEEIKKLAEGYPQAERDAKLAELFSAALAAINRHRGTIVDGIERFQKRQLARAKKLEEEGVALAELQEKGATPDKVADAQQRYDWDARVFQERQQNMPVACEIPVLIEQRAFALAQAIRAQMQN